MSNKKGISMVSLIVVIVSIIILAGIAVVAGYRYIERGKEAEKETLTTLISDAVYRRQNDYNIDSSKKYYEGKALKQEQITEGSSGFFKELPDNFDAEKSRITDELNGLKPIWFIIDGKDAEALGVVKASEYEKYLVKNYDDTTEEYVPVALVEYITGSTYLVEAKKTSVSGLSPSNHEHVYTVASCTEPAKCKICGDILQPALGHNVSPATCTQPEVCTRCGTVFAPAKGHDFEGQPYEHDAIRHWISCKNGCGTKKENELHSKNYITVSDYYHIENCYVCSWESTETDHNLVIENIDNTHHRRYCTLCDYSVIHTDTGWHNEDENYHWKSCDICGPVLFKGEHVDVNPEDRYCDVCNRFVDHVPPKAFDDGDITVVSRTTHQIEVRAITEDDEGGGGINKYEFSIDNGSSWHTVMIEGTEAGVYKFENLKDDRTYNILVRAYDKGSNYVEGSISGSTYAVPAEAVEYELSPSVVTKENVNVSLTMPTLTLPQIAIDELQIMYKVNGISADWELYENPIQVTREEPTVIYTKIVDKRTPTPNSSTDVGTINVTNKDKTPPSIRIQATGTNQTQTSHNASVVITDAKAGITQGTQIYYAWTPTTDAPSSYEAYVVVPTTGNEKVLAVSTPTGVKGRYYLWIKEGVQDAVGNATSQAVRSDMFFDIDDVPPELSTRTMRNEESKAIDNLYVKTDGVVTIRIIADKTLSQGPLVELGTKSIRATSTDSINWIARITIDNTFTEGLLDDIRFSDYISTSGKNGNPYTTTSDNEYVTYDRTLPVLEYINK